MGRKDYTEALRVVGDGGWPGAKIYDTLLIGCAARSGAERIYTFNLADVLVQPGTHSTAQNSLYEQQFVPFRVAAIGRAHV